MTVTAFADRFLRLPDGAGALRPMVFTEPQREFFAGWERVHEDGTPVYRQAAFSVPKQSFKTTTAQLCVLHHLYCGTDPDRHAVMVSTGLTQSEDVGFAGCVRFIERSPRLKKHTRILTRELVYTETVTEPRTGGTYKQEHRITYLPSVRAADLHHGTPVSLAWIDEVWALGSGGYSLVEAVMPSPMRRDGRLLLTSYAGLKTHRKPGYVWFDVWTRAEQHDPTLLAVIRSGPDAYKSNPSITEAFLESQRRLLAHVPARFARFWRNEWQTSDSGTFLSSSEIADALDPALVEPAGPTSGVAYALGLDLGLTHDRAALVMSHVGTDGKVTVDLVRIWAGTRERPADLIEIEATVRDLATRFKATVDADGWQAAFMVQRLERDGIFVRVHTIEQTKLNNYATLLRTLFTGRKIRIPAEATVLIEELETIEAEELTRRDLVRFTSGDGGFDDATMALCLSTERFVDFANTDGRLRLRHTTIGRLPMADIAGCRLGGWPDSCPLDDGASAHAGCGRCAAYVSATNAHTAFLARGEPWIDLRRFIHEQMEPCDWLRDRRFSRATQYF